MLHSFQNNNFFLMDEHALSLWTQEPYHNPSRCGMQKEFFQSLAFGRCNMGLTEFPSVKLSIGRSTIPTLPGISQHSIYLYVNQEWWWRRVLFACSKVLHLVVKTASLFSRFVHSDTYKSVVKITNF